MHGKELVAAYCKSKGIELALINKPVYQEKAIRKYGFHDWKSCLATIGHGGIKEASVVNKMYDEYYKDHPVQVTDEQILEENKNESQNGLHRKSKSGIVVNGLYDVAAHFAKCCSPVPGDEICGYITRGRGVTIHRTDCINMIHLSDMEKTRLIEAEWQKGTGSEHELYLGEIRVYGINRTGLLVDVSRILTERGIDIDSVSSKTSKQGIATISIAFAIGGKEELNSIIEKIRQVESVIDIERASG